MWKRHLWIQHLLRLITNFFRWSRIFLNIFLLNTENPCLWEANVFCFCLFQQEYIVQNGTKYSRMNQVKFVEESLWKIWSYMLCLSRSYQFKFFKSCLPQIPLGPFVNTLSHISLETKERSRKIVLPSKRKTINWNFTSPVLIKFCC